MENMSIDDTYLTVLSTNWETRELIGNTERSEKLEKMYETIRKIDKLLDDVGPYCSKTINETEKAIMSLLKNESLF